MKMLEVADETFRLYRRSFWLLFGIGAIPYVPAMLLIGLGQAQAVFVPEDLPGPGDMPNVGLMAGAMGAGWLLIAIASVIAQAAIIKAVSDRYLGQSSTIGGSYRFVLSRLGALVLTMMLSGLLVLAGFIFCIVPGVIFAFWIAFVVPVLMIEGHKHTRAIQRSRYLIRDGVWARYLLVTLVNGLIAQVAQGALSTPFQLLGTTLQIPGLVAVSGFFNGVAQAAVMPIGLVATVLLYYDSRMRKEGFDLQILANELSERVAAGSEGVGPEQPTPPGTGPV
jgi:hypothetical protein